MNLAFGFTLAAPMTREFVIEHVPALAVIVAFITALGLAFFVLMRPYNRRRNSRLRQRKLLGAGLCPRCGYDVRGTPHRCPECGLAVLKSRRL
jgi:hypothetical protein